MIDFFQKTAHRCICVPAAVLRMATYVSIKVALGCSRCQTTSDALRRLTETTVSDLEGTPGDHPFSYLTGISNY
jgi:hypothetical protein